MKTLRKQCALALLFMSCVAVVGSWAYAQQRFQALAYRPDFAFYHQFAARAGSAELSDAQTFNVKGDNMFGIVGREGRDHLHQAIHFEPIKYLDALAVSLGGSTGWMFFWRSLVHAFPLLVLAWAARSSDTPALLALTGLAYVSYPAFLAHASFDLRPYQVLAPALFGLFVAIHQKMGEGWILGSLLLALSAREESLLLAGFALVFLILWTPERTALLKKVGVTWGTWLILTLGYMSWTGYEVARSVPGNIVFGLVSLAALAGPWFMARWYPRLAQLATILAPAGIVILALIRSRWAHDLGLLYGALHPRPFVAVPVLIFGLLWLGSYRPTWSRTALGALICFSIAVHLFSPQTPIRNLSWQQKRGESARLVFAEKARLDSRNSGVLCDENTCQAFADFEKAFHYNAVFGEAGFPQRGPEEVNLPIWLEQFDSIVVSEEVLKRLEAAGFDPDDGWTVARDGAFVVAHRP